MAPQSTKDRVVERQVRHESRVLVAVVDPHLQERLTAGLEMCGFSVEATSNASAALRLAHSSAPDAIVVDFALQTPSGDSVFESMRDRPEQGLIVVTGKDSERERIVALDAGADDAMSFPVGVDELAMRCEAVLRRAQPSTTPRIPLPARVLRLGPLQVDLGRKEAWVRGHEVMTTKTELTLLEILCSQPVRVCTRSSMIADLWGPNWVGAGHLLDTHVGNLHRKLREHAPDLRFIRIVRGVGFCLTDELLAA
ncbi:MAG: two-component system, OmpR family, response regulator [Ilumatobacteraceae bacterium]|nr:two-component system, OmpR family, response regulator [Ilumatobacteraceae bacterium]